MHRQEWLAVGSVDPIHTLMKWAWINPHKVLLHLTNYQNLCLTRRVLRLMQLQIECIWRDTKCIDRNAWLHYSHIFGYWHVLIFWRDAWRLANDRNLILICRVLLIIQLHIKCIWKDTKCIDKNAWLHYSHIFRVLAYARSESQTGCIFSQLQTSVARQSAFLGILMTKTQFSRQSTICLSLPPS